MEIVIKISKEMYKSIQQRSTEIQAKGWTLESAVLNGTPLEDIPSAEKAGHWIWQTEDVNYHEEHGEVIVDKAVWEDAERALKAIDGIRSEIQAEIEVESQNHDTLDGYSEGRYDVLIRFRNIIDKYMKVGEPQERSDKE